MDMEKQQTVKYNILSPSWWVTSVLPWLGKMMLEKRYDHAGRHYVMEADWDNLILLDSCRYDMFTDKNSIEGELSAVISHGSSSSGFLEQIRDETHHDTVYVTANPHYEVMGFENIFHDVINVWDIGWNEELKTVTPERMVEATKEAHTNYPNKRIFSHFMQPHYPFIGEAAKEVGSHAGFEYSVRTAKTGEGSRDHENVWQLLKQGEVEKDAVWEAYNENLEIVLPHVAELIKFFGEKTVVTSDHGNLVGEFVFPFPRRKYGHPSGFHAKNLVKVPWLVAEAGPRKSTESEPPTGGGSDATPNEVERRLADLGYLN